MHASIILKILGALLMLFSVLANLLPIFISVIYSDGMLMSFLSSTAIIFSIGGLLFISARNKTGRELGTRDGFLIVTLFWTVLGVAGCLPFVFSSALNLSVTDAIFESLSGLTTTGATVISGLDDLPKSLLFYRQQLQWLGGMGIIVLAISLLPMLGIGGMQLYRAESPGPIKDNKLLPRLAETAKALWYIYLALTVICAASYGFAGMNFFDAVSHSFATIAIGGFSTHDQSIAYYESSAIESVAVIFMFIAGVNFAMHFTAWQTRSIRHYFRDPEFLFYSFILLSVSVVTILILYLSEV